MTTTLLALFFVLLAAIVTSTLAEKLNLPGLIGPLVVGIFIGPPVFNLIQPTEILEFIAEVGIMGLMFIAGLESNLTLLRKYIKPAASVALFGIIVPMASFVFVVYYILGQSLTLAIFWGLIFSAMSTSITIDVLKDSQQLQSKNGTTIIGAAIIDDLLAMLMLGIFLSLVTTGATKTNSLPVALILNVLFFVIALLAVRYIVPFLMHTVMPKMHLRQKNAVAMFIIAFGLAVIATKFGLSGIIGAFFAGVALAQTDVREELEQSAEVMSYGFFVPVFLVTVGFHVNFAGMSAHWLAIVALTILAIATKFLGSGLGAKVVGYNYLDAGIVGAGTIPRGEFSIVIAQIGLEAGIINTTVYSEILIIIILATIAGPILLKLLFNVQAKRAERSTTNS